GQIHKSRTEFPLVRRLPKFLFDSLRNGDIAFAPENHHAPTRPGRRLSRQPKKVIQRPAFRGSIFRARIKAEPVRIVREFEFLSCGRDFAGRHFEKGRQRVRVGAECGYEMQIVTDLVNIRARSSAPHLVIAGTCGGGAGATVVTGDELFNFTNRTFSRRRATGARSNGIRQKIIPSRTPVTNALRNTRQPQLQGRAMRVGEGEARSKMSRAKFSRHAPEGVPL